MAKTKWQQISWEKVGVYIAMASIVVAFAFKLNEVSERLSRLEGIIEERARK